MPWRVTPSLAPARPFDMTNALEPAGSAGGARPVHPRGTPPVAGSRPSALRLAIAVSTAAASATVRACGPIVSCVCEIGTTPARLVMPRVGLMPTMPFACAGQTMLPSVSVARATAHKFAETAAPDPELEPQGFRSNAYGLLH